MSDDIRSQVTQMVESEYETLADLFADPNYYANRYWHYAICGDEKNEGHISLPCVVRTVAEMYVTGSKLYTHEVQDLKHAVFLIEYIKQYMEEDTSKVFIQDLFFKSLKEHIQGLYPFMVATIHHRFKSALSAEGKMRGKIILTDIYEDLLKTPEKYFDEVTPELIDCIRTMRYENYENSPIRDLNGYRLIVHSVAKRTDEAFLRDQLILIANEVATFFEKTGFDVIKIKDYVSSPKPNGYSSIHLILRIQNWNVEFQIRTPKMDYDAEFDPQQNHADYKNRTYQDLKPILELFCDSCNRRTLHETTGLLKHMAPNSWLFVPKDEFIPNSIVELKPFENLEALRNIFQK